MKSKIVFYEHKIYVKSSIDQWKWTQSKDLARLFFALEVRNFYFATGMGEGALGRTSCEIKSDNKINKFKLTGMHDNVEWNKPKRFCPLAEICATSYM